MHILSDALPYVIRQSHILDCHISVHPLISFLKWISAILGLVPGWYLVFVVISTTRHQISFKRHVGSVIWLLYPIGLSTQVTSYT